MRALAIILAGFFLLALESPLLHELNVQQYAPDIVLVMAIYIGLTSSFGVGLLLAVTLGLLKDGFAFGTPIGMYAEITVVATMVAYRLSRRLVVRGPVGAMLVSLVFSIGASLLELVLSLVFVRNFGSNGGGAGLILGSMIPQALVTAPFGIVVFWLLDRLDALTTRNSDSVFM